MNINASNIMQNNNFCQKIRNKINGIGKWGFLIVMIIVFYACNGNKETNNSAATTAASFKIWGNCEMCKETIEGALKVDGVIKADWSKDTKIIAVSFDSTKINLDQIQKNVAAAGYDNENYKGDDKAYAGLPECCQYTRK